MLSYNKQIKNRSLYNRLESVYKAHSLQMLSFCHGMACGVAVEKLGCSKEEERYNALLVRLVEMKEKELEGRIL